MDDGDPIPEAERVAGECLAIRVRLINRVISGIYDEALRPHKIRVSQANLLTAVARAGRLRPVDLCRLIRIDKSTLSRDIEVMKRAGWVASEPPEGGRNQTLHLTPVGRRLVAALLPAWEQAQAKARACLGPDGAAQVHAIAAHLGFLS